ncbi:nuclear transport factor 2 family protein [soil metagenome]
MHIDTDHDDDWSDTHPRDGVRRVVGSFGASARNLTEQTFAPGLAGALSALETFYFALNTAQLDLVVDNWATHPLVQMDNPLGGVTRGRPALRNVYDRLFRSGARLVVTLSEITMYVGVDHVVFAGRENGTFVDPSTGDEVSVEIRTNRYFRHETTVGRWRQFHHHGSVDDVASLSAYRTSVASHDLSVDNERSKS